jgi:hypothetical protein
MIRCILDRIDAHDLIVGRRPHESLQFPNQIVMVRLTRAESVKSLMKRRVIEDGSEITHGHALRPPAIVMLGSHQVAPLQGTDRALQRGPPH